VLACVRSCRYYRSLGQHERQQ